MTEPLHSPAPQTPPDGTAPAAPEAEAPPAEAPPAEAPPAGTGAPAVDADPAAADAPAPPDTGASPPARTVSPRLPWIVAAIAFAIAVAATVFGLTSYRTAADLREREAARASAQEAGEVVALQITTINGAQIDRWLEQTRSLATGQFEEDLTRGYDEALRTEFRDSGIRTVGEVIQSFVQEVDGDEAVVFVIVRQTTARSGSSETIEDELRMEVTLTAQDGEWLASDVAVLTPTPPLTAPGAGGGG